MYRCVMYRFETHRFVLISFCNVPLCISTFSWEYLTNDQTQGRDRLAVQHMNKYFTHLATFYEDDNMHFYDLWIVFAPA
jgi:hypothetical protein